MKRNNGITLIALVVTIVVLLILAGISIGVLTGDNGIITQAKEGKDSAEISEEKEVISVSAVQAMNEDAIGNLKQNKLQEKLDTNTGNGATEVIDSVDTLVVKFIEKDRYYEIDQNGNVDGPKKLVKDDNAGDLSKGGTADGSEENPFQINCIEDLVEFSIMVNGGNTELGIKWNVFKNQYVALMRNLDFKSIFSYNDYTTTKYGDLNTDGIVEDIKTELTKTAEGCVGFTPIGQGANNVTAGFNGTFDGKENEIQNIYQNYNEGICVGLFGGTGTLAEIKNLTITGNITNKAWHAAGICGQGYATITNCKNYANVTGYNMVGGISAWSRNDITDCINYGNITITGRDWSYGGGGGIVGNLDGVSIINCINKGNIKGYGGVGYGVSSDVRDPFVGGIAGYGYGKIIGCINEGSTSSGISGYISGGNIDIINCYNIGECNNGIVNAVSGQGWTGIISVNIKNCYNLGRTSNAGIVGYQGNVCASNTINIENCYSAGISNKAIIGSIKTSESTETITNITNTYYDNTKTTDIGAHIEGITGLSIKNNTEFVETLNNNVGDNTDWKRWKLGQDGYPTFE